MARNQRFIVWAALAISLLMILFPPWFVELQVPAGLNIVTVRQNAGYRALWSPPNQTGFVKEEGKTPVIGYGVIDVSRLTVQLIGVLVLSGGLLAASRKKPD